MKRVAVHTVLRVAAIILLPMLLLLITGCGQDSESSGGDASDTVGVGVPPMYVAQALVFKEAGEPAVERNYRQLLKACRDAAMTTTALSEDDAKKLGRTYFQLWFDDKHWAWQEDAWDFKMSEDPAELCQFPVTHESYKSVSTARAHLSIDLMVKTAINEPNTGFMPGGGIDPGDDSQLDDASAKIVGIQRLGYATDASAACAGVGPSRITMKATPGAKDASGGFLRLRIVVRQPHTIRAPSYFGFTPLTAWAAS